MSLIPFLYDNRLVERDFFRPNFSQPFDLVPQDFFQPWGNVFRQLEQLTSGVNQLALKDDSKQSTDSDKFQVNIDVQHFTPEEISVKVVDRYVTVERKHEEKRDEHGYVSRQFIRRYALPEGCLPDVVESKLSSDGVLTITAPKVLALPSSGEKIVPITKTGPIKTQINGNADAVKE